MPESDKDNKKVEPTLEPLLQAHIGKQLRQMYDAMTREPVPERFKLLLDRLEAGETPQDHGRQNAEAGVDEAGAA
jgi:Anti-sigma factor NepR